MGTTFSDIITLAMSSKIINDLTWEQGLAQNAALFFRRKSQSLMVSIPKFNRPPEMRSYLAHTAPMYDSYTYTAEASETPVTVATGMTGYELFNCGIVVTDKFGGVEYVVAAADYDSGTGDVIIHATAENPIAEGAVYEMDFYTDGTFTNELNAEIQEILCMCMKVIWETGFSGSWLDRTPVLQDKTFKRASTEGAWTTAQESKRRTAQIELSDRLMKFEQDIQYRNVVHTGKPFNP